MAASAVQPSAADRISTTSRDSNRFEGVGAQSRTRCSSYVPPILMFGLSFRREGSLAGGPHAGTAHQLKETLAWLLATCS
jgi:hypothetical protein